MEKLNVVVHSWWRLLRSTVNVRYSFQGQNKTMAYILAIQRLVLGIILYPLAVLYLLGFYISAGVSLWRLIEHDFGDTGGANQKPALQVLYTLAVVQGVLFCCKTMNGFVSRTRLAQVVAEVARVDQELVAKYLHETVEGCQKDPSFASGRNFVTYGVNLMMEAKSNEDFIAGIKVLGYATDDESGAKVLAKYQSTRSSYWSAIIKKLLEIAGSRSTETRKIKEDVLCILDSVASCISLEQFPGMIELICSVEQLEEYEKDNIKSERRFGRRDCSFLDFLYQLIQRHCFRGKRKTVANKRKNNILIIKAASIIHKLVDNKDNRKCLGTCVSDTTLDKIASLPIRLHRENHDPFGVYEKSDLQMLVQCWVLTERLLVALRETRSLPLQPATPVGVGEGGHTRREEITPEEFKERSIKCTIKGSIESTIRCIFDCFDCSATQKRQAIQILLHLSWDMSFIAENSESSKRRLSWVLLLILCSTDDEYCSNFDVIRSLAGQKLSEMLREKHDELPSLKESERELQSIRLALGDLKTAFDADSEDISIRTHATIIMEGLISRLDYTGYSEVVEKFLVDAIPKVVMETLTLCRSITAERQEQANDVEMGNVSWANQDGCNDSERLRKALASLCYFGYMDSSYTMWSNFMQTASKTCKEQGTSFEDFDGLLCQSLALSCSSRWE